MPEQSTTSQTSYSKFIIGAIVLVLAAGAWWFYSQNSSILPLAAGDSIESWDFQGARNDDGPLEEGVHKEIARFEGLLGGDQSGMNDDPTDYTLYVAIAQQYEQLGDGKAARDNLEKALVIDSETTGLAWHNLGSLYNRLGAYNTARVAYKKAIEAQSHISNYHIAYLNFLVSHFASDQAGVDGAFSDAHAALGDDPSVLQIEAQWYEKSGRKDKAIEALNKMKQILPDFAATADAEIARLQK